MGVPVAEGEDTEGLLGWLDAVLGLDTILDPGKADRRRALEMEQAGIEEWGALRDYLPRQSDITPEWDLALEGDDLTMERSALAGAQADGGAISAQRQALADLRSVYEGGGYTDAERAQLRQVQRNAALGEQAQRGALQQSMAARGMGGGGAELAGSLAAQQGFADRSAASADAVGIAGQQRALQALQQYGGLAGQIRQQSFGEEATRASAVDDFNRYNLDYRRGVRGRNTDRQNTYNEGTARARAAGAQQAFDNRTSLVAGMTGQYGGAAGGSRQDAAQRAQSTAQGLQAITGLVSSLYGTGGE